MRATVNQLLTLAEKQTINGFDVVDWFRDKTNALGVRLYEATAFVEIREK